VFIIVTSILDLNLMKNLVKCYIRSIAIYGAENCALGKVDQNYLESSEMWLWRRMEKIICTDSVKNEEVLRGVKEKGTSYIK
jgi:hypothetical protein